MRSSSLEVFLPKGFSLRAFPALLQSFPIPTPPSIHVEMFGEQTIPGPASHPCPCPLEFLPKQSRDCVLWLPRSHPFLFPSFFTDSLQGEGKLEKKNLSGAVGCGLSQKNPNPRWNLSLQEGKMFLLGSLPAWKKPLFIGRKNLREIFVCSFQLSSKSSRERDAQGNGGDGNLWGKPREWGFIWDLTLEEATDVEKVFPNR